MACCAVCGGGPRPVLTGLRPVADHLLIPASCGSVRPPQRFVREFGPGVELPGDDRTTRGGTRDIEVPGAVSNTRPPQPPVYRFGEFELDCALRELRRSGSPVAIQPKAFELLRYLIEHRDRAVDKEELQDVLWPRTIVTEASLTRSVMKARRAVDDDSERQAVIRTVHGHGYRFLPEIESAEPVPATEGAPAAAPTQPETPVADSGATRPRADRRWLSLWAVVVLAVALGAWWLAARDVTAGPVRVAVLPVDNATGDGGLEWTGTGLMSLLNRLLENHGIEVVSDRTVLALAGDRAATDLLAPGSGFRELLARTQGATHVLAARLEYVEGAYRLYYELTGDGDRPVSRSGVGAEATSMIPEVAATVAALVSHGRPTDERRRVISADDFLNEAYARALSLQFAGRNEEAKRLFQVVMEQEPDLFWPRYEYALSARTLREWHIAEPMLIELAAEAAADGAIAEQTAALNSLGIAYLNQDRLDRARQQFEEVLRLTEGTTLYDRMSAANVNLGLVASNTGDYELAKRHLDRAIELTRVQGIESLPGTITNNLSGVLIRLGRYDEAEVQSRDAIANFRVTGNRLYEASALSRLSSVLRHQGRFDEAEEAQELALSIRRELGNRVGESSSYLSLAALATERGSLTRARLYAEQAHDIGLEIQDRYVTASALAAMATADRRLGRSADAAAGFRAAGAIFRDIGNRMNEQATMRDLARCLLDQGDVRAAAAISDELLARSIERGERREEARALALQAEIATASGDPDGAVDALRSALFIARELADTGIELEVIQELARAYLELEQAADARPLMERLRIDRPGQPETLRLDARLAYLQGDVAGAASHMETLRATAAEAWTEEDTALLESYRAELPDDPSDLP